MSILRQAMDGFLAGQAHKPVMAPFIEHLAARIAGISYQEMTSDAGSWTAALSRTADLLQIEGVIVGGDITLLVEALGGSIEWQDDRPQMSKPPISINTEPTAFGRLNTAIETANRLFQVLRKTHGCIAAMPGPMTLVSQIYGEVDLVDGLSALKPALVSVAEAYCMTRPDILLLIETQTSVVGQSGSLLRRIFNAIRNVASYYDVRVALYVEGGSISDFPTLSTFNTDFYVLSPNQDNLNFLVKNMAKFGQPTEGLGLVLPMDDSDGVETIIQNVSGTLGNRQGLLMMSSAEISADVDIERLSILLNRFRAMPLQEKREICLDA